MNRFLLAKILVFTFVINANAQDPSLQWTNVIEGAGWNRAYSIKCGTDGFVYVSGSFEDTVDFDPGSEVFELISEGQTDIFVAKYHTSGTFIWAVSVGGIDKDIGLSLDLDEGNSIYLTGSYRESVDFDPGAGEFSMTSTGASDSFLMKLDSDGNFIWANSTGGSATDVGSCVHVDLDNNVYVTGFINVDVDLDPGVGEILVSTGEWQDCFIQKFYPDGNLIWANSFGSTGFTDRSYGATTDNIGNLYLTGYFADTVDFDLGIDIEEHISNGSHDIYILKLDPDGNFLWVKTIGGVGNDEANYIEIDDDNNVLVTGAYKDSVDFDPGLGETSYTYTGYTDIFIVKLNEDGNFQWARSFGSSSPSGEDIGRELRADSDNNIYLTGSYQDTVDFDPGSGVFELISTGSPDGFLLKLTPTGNFEWAGTFGSSAINPVFAIDIDTLDRIFLTGSYTFWGGDCDPGLDTLWLESDGAPSAFVQKYLECLPSYDSISVVSCAPYVSPSGDLVVEESGFFSDVVINSVGCDSVINIDLTILPSSIGDTSAVECFSFTWYGQVYSESGLYSDTLINAVGCDSILSLDLIILEVDTSISYSYPLISANAPAPATYQWVDCNDDYNFVIGETSQSFAPTESGSYAVIVTESGCTDTSACIDFEIDESGINSDGEERITVAPNPGNGKFFVTLDQKYSKVSLLVSDAIGRQVLAVSFHEVSSFDFNLKNQSGIYFIEIISEGQLLAKKRLVNL